MKILFAHDERVKIDNEGTTYTGGAFNNEVWKRYLFISDSLTVLLRKEKKVYTKEFAKGKFNHFDTDKINLVIIDDLFNSYQSFLSPKLRIDVQKSISEQVKKNDLIIARLPSTIGNLAVKYAKKYKKPYLVEMVGCPWDALWNHSFKGKVIAPVKYLKTRASVKDASHVLYVTNEFLQKRYPTKGKSIGCSDVTIPPINEEIIERRKEKIITRNKNLPIILGTTAATDVRYKGQEYIIEAIAMLNKEGFNYEYYLAGDGDTNYLKSIAIKNGVLDKVKFLGALPHDEIFKFLDNIDIYIQPSKTEGLPRALIEAMSRGCPALGSNVGGIPELISKKFTFNVGNKHEICQLIKELTPDVMLQVSNRNFNKAKEFESNKLNDKRLSFYKDFISKH